MIEVIVVGEGQTEETFVRDVIAPAFWPHDVSIQARLIRTSASARGGALSRDRVVRFLRNTLRERSNTYVTTFFDLYGLSSDFPGVREHVNVVDPIQRAIEIEMSVARVVLEAAQCSADRFLPHIQPHEFEALLFSDVTWATSYEPGWRAEAGRLQAARASVATPEHLDDGRTSHPSARLSELQDPHYNKVLHGSLLAARIGLDRIRAECAHFAAWMEKLERLLPL